MQRARRRPAAAPGSGGEALGCAHVSETQPPRAPRAVGGGRTCYYCVENERASRGSPELAERSCGGAGARCARTQVSLLNSTPSAESELSAHQDTDKHARPSQPCKVKGRGGVRLAAPDRPARTDTAHQSHWHRSDTGPGIETPAGPGTIPAGQLTFWDPPGPR